MKRRWFAVGFIVLALLSSSLAAYARYTAIFSLSSTLEIDSNGTASCYGKVKPESASTTSTITVQLQQKRNSTWYPYATWTASGQGGGGVSKTGTQTVASGYEYRVVTTGTIFDLDGKKLESAEKNSTTKTY